jgi:hypothetical protein
MKNGHERVEPLAFKSSRVKNHYFFQQIIKMDNEAKIRLIEMKSMNWAREDQQTNTNDVSR